jgi:hypothetical protein
MPEPVVPLAELERDLPTPAAGWAAELAGRGVEVVLDDLGRASVTRAAARLLFTEHLAQEELAARKRAELEQRAIEADQRFRASLPPGIAADQVPEGISAGQLMMLSDPEREKGRRESVLEHSLSNPAGALIYHPINEDAS